MNKKLEAAAKESAKHYFLNVANTTKHRTDDGLSFRDDYVPSITATWNTYDYAFIAGAEWALREAIGILKVYKLSSNAIHELEQILSSKGENNGTK